MQACLRVNRYRHITSTAFDDCFGTSGGGARDSDVRHLGWYSEGRKSSLNWKSLDGGHWMKSTQLTRY